MSKDELIEDIRLSLNTIKVIDTHEHLWDESWRLENIGDWSSLFYHYGITALKSAGMNDIESEKLYAKDTSHNEKWNIFSKYFPLAKNTAYIKAALIAIKDIYGIEEITSDSMHELSSRIKQTIKPGFYRELLRDKANIDYCMVNCFDRDNNDDRFPLRDWGDIELLKPDLYADCLIYPMGKRLLELKSEEDCSSLSGWIKGINSIFAKYQSICSSVKIGSAYSGHLAFNETVSFSDAEAMFKRHIQKQMDYADARPLIDYLFYQVLRNALEYNLPIKFHTGIYSGGIEFNCSRNNVRDLAEIAQKYPDIKFIVMHIAYPYQNELVMAIKQIPNVYADMCWAWIVDYQSSKQFLKAALTTAPINKTMGFGGDYALPENTYGHLQLAKCGIANVLAELVEDSYFTLDDAKIAGEFILRESAEILYVR